MTLAGKRILVTAGPTHEPIDPVRVIANRSSGRQGFAVAAAAAAAGAKVSLIAGPVALETPAGVDRIDVETAEEMANAVFAALPADAAILVAAVADWRVEPSEAKLKKRAGPPRLELVHAGAASNGGGNYTITLVVQNTGSSGSPPRRRMSSIKLSRSARQRRPTGSSPTMCPAT